MPSHFLVCPYIIGKLVVAKVYNMTGITPMFPYGNKLDLINYCAKNELIWNMKIVN